MHSLLKWNMCYFDINGQHMEQSILIMADKQENEMQFAVPLSLGRMFFEKRLHNVQALLRRNDQRNSRLYHLQFSRACQIYRHLFYPRGDQKTC